MQMLEKFYSDIEKASKKEDFVDSMIYIFNKAIRNYDKNLVGLADDLVVYWQTEYGKTQSQNAEEAGKWFFNLFSFLTNNFETQMDFSDKDWEEIKFSLNAIEDDLDLDYLHIFMSILLDRKKI